MINKPPHDAMMKSAPAEKILTEYHFAGDDGRVARVVQAHDIVEATKLYWEAEDGATNTERLESEVVKEVINKPEPPEQGGEV